MLQHLGADGVRLVPVDQLAGGERRVAGVGDHRKESGQRDRSGSARPKHPVLAQAIDCNHQHALHRRLVEKLLQYEVDDGLGGGHPVDLGLQRFRVGCSRVIALQQECSKAGVFVQLRRHTRRVQHARKPRAQLLQGHRPLASGKHGAQGRPQRFSYRGVHVAVLVAARLHWSNKRARFANHVGVNRLRDGEKVRRHVCLKRPQHFSQ